MSLLGAKFSGLGTVLVIVFTIVEIVTMVYWLKLAPGKPWLAIAILSVGLVVEHFISAATGVHISKKE